MARAYLYFLSTISERSSEVDSAKAAIPASGYFMGFEYEGYTIDPWQPCQQASGDAPDGQSFLLQ